MTRERTRVVTACGRVILLVVMVLLTGVGITAAEEGKTSHSSITYLTSLTAYVGAGSDQGLAPGSRVEIVRNGLVVAVLEVTESTGTRAVCSLGKATPPLRIGDRVRFNPEISEVDDSGAMPQASPRRSFQQWSRNAGLRGRVGARYLAVSDRSGDGQDFSRPALDLRLDGTSVGGSPFDVNVDLRARRITETDSGGVESLTTRTSAYRLSTTIRPLGTPWRLTLGRQFSPHLSSVSLFDGIQGEYRKERWAVGGISGTQPDAVDLGYSSKVREHGGYLSWFNRAGQERNWTMVTGLVGSYEEGEINREFSYLQASFRGPKLAAWVVEEIDLNRGWKETVEGETLSMTSTFATINYRATEFWNLRAGYDNRRSVRLYRDRVTPETEFDDEYRNGVWGGVGLRFAKHFSAGLDVRSSGGGSLGGADGYTLSLGVSGLTRASVDVRTRSTRYENDRTEGWLHSVSTGLSLGSRIHAELSGGVRDEKSLELPALDDQVSWVGLELDVLLGRSWYMGLSMERSDGDFEAVDQIYTSLTYRF